MIAIELVIIIAACTFLAGYAANYALNYMKTHPKVEETASPLEIEEAAYKKLTETLKKQQTYVENVLLNVGKAKAKLDSRIETVADIKAEFERASAAGAPEAKIDDIALRFSRARAAVSEQEKIVEEAQKVADEAGKTLTDALKAVSDFEQQVDTDRSREDLAQLHRYNADAKQQALDIQTTLSKVGQARRSVERKLEEARAASTLTEGSAVDQARSSLSERAQVLTGRAELEGKTKPAQELLEVEVIVPASENSAASRN